MLVAEPTISAYGRLVRTARSSMFGAEIRDASNLVTCSPVSKAQGNLLAIQTRNARWSVFAAALTALAAIAGVVSMYLSNSASATQQVAAIDAGDQRTASAQGSNDEPESEAALADKPQQRSDPKPADPSQPGVADSPFDTGGWDSLREQGDPWVLSVMAGLNNTKLPAWAMRLPVEEPYRFKLKICKNGTVEKVYSKESSGNSDVDGAVRGELERLKFDAIPTHIVEHLDASCETLAYTFEWTKGRIR